MRPTPVDITALVKDGRHFARQNPAGFVEVVDSVSGRVVAALAGASSLLGDRQLVLERRLTAQGREVLVETSVDTDHMDRFKDREYHPWIIDILCERLVTDSMSSITTICRQPDMPSYPTLMQWRLKYPEIDEKIRRAREDRAELLRDQALTEAMENVDHKFPTQAAKLKVDTLQWAAAMDNARYSPKAKLEATIHAPTQIIVHTGIDRGAQVAEPEREVAEAAKTLETGVDNESQCVPRSTEPGVEDRGHASAQGGGDRGGPAPIEQTVRDKVSGGWDCGIEDTGGF